MRESALIAHKPSGMTFEEAAAIPDGGPRARVLLPKGGTEGGRRSSSTARRLGRTARRAAAHFGADVTAVGNTQNLDVVRSARTA